MHLDQLIEIDSPESLLPRLSERAELTVLGQDHRALSGHMPGAYGQHGREHDTTPGGGSASRLDNLRRPPPDSSRHRPAASLIEHRRLRLHRGKPAPGSGLVVHSASVSERAMGEQDTIFNLAEILAGWRADNPDINVETFLLAGPPRDTMARCRLTHSCWLLVFPTGAGSLRAGSVPLRARYSIAPPARSPLSPSSSSDQRRRTRAHRTWPTTLRPDTCSQRNRRNIHRLPPAQGSSSLVQFPGVQGDCLIWAAGSSVPPCVIILRCPDHGNPKHGVELGDRSQILHRWTPPTPKNSRASRCTAG